jgi:hypothetical protein
VVSANAPFSPHGEMRESDEKVCSISVKMALSPRDENGQKTERA